MKIFRIREESKSGDFAYRSVVHKPCGNWHSESRQKIANGEVLLMHWCRGDDELPCSDYVPTTAPSGLFSERAFRSIQYIAPTADQYLVRLDDGLALFGLKPRNFSTDDSVIDHLFIMYPRHSYPLVTEVFKQTWEQHGFTGATFELVDELDDGLFLTV